MLVVMSSNSDKRFGLVDKTDGVGGGIYEQADSAKPLGPLSASSMGHPSVTKA